MKLKKQLLTLLLVVGIVFSLPLTTFAAPGNTTVYVTRTGEKYHSNGCQYLRKSKIAISLQDAVSSGYDACSRCNPPILTASMPTPAPAPAPQPATPSPTQQTQPTAPAIQSQETTAEPVDPLMQAQFEMFGTIHNAYIVQFNTLMQINPAAIDSLLTQRVALIMQLDQMETHQFVEHVCMVYLVQLGLNNAGCFIGDLNGLMDAPTVQSIANFQQAIGLPATGNLDQTTIDLLLNSAQLPAAG